MRYQIPKEVAIIINQLKKAGYESYIVGGCVRDLILSRKTKDWDFTTNAEPEQIQKLFPHSFYDNSFGTVGVPVELPMSSKKSVKVIFEITTFRSEHGYTDFRHPDKISWGKNLKDDLQRRDFTINAMAYDGKDIIDLYDGAHDLKYKIIRAVGNPQLRFQEDALRMMRAIRIATELSFTVEKNTFDAIKKHAYLLRKISSERIRDELLKIVASDYPSDGIKLLRNCGILAIILPEVERCFGVEQKSPKRHHVYDVGTHLINSLKHCPCKDKIVRLATLLHDIGKPATFQKTPSGVITFYNHEIIGASIIRNIAHRLKFAKKDREKLVRLVRFHQFTVDERQTDSAIRRFIRNIGEENIYDMLSLRTADRLGGAATETSWRLELFKKRISQVLKQPFIIADLHISGYDVMDIYKIKPGPLVGKVLQILFQEVVEKKIMNKKTSLIKRLKDLKSAFDR